MINKTTILLATLLMSTFIWAQEAKDVLGVWKTIDDESGEAKSYVELFMKGDKLYGKVIKILNPAKVDNVCSLCEDDDDRKDQKILGMEIVKDMIWDEDEWEDGTILDPNKGSVYDCKLWLGDDDKDKLYVRGYISFLFRTQYWYKVK